MKQNTGGILDGQTGGRPFTGAWIETVNVRPCGESYGGRPFTGAWIETECSVTWQHPCLGSPLHGGVD